MMTLIVSIYCIGSLIGPKDYSVFIMDLTILIIIQCMLTFFFEMHSLAILNVLEPFFKSYWALGTGDLTSALVVLR